MPPAVCCAATSPGGPGEEKEMQTPAFVGEFVEAVRLVDVKKPSRFLRRVFIVL